MTANTPTKAQIEAAKEVLAEPEQYSNEVRLMAFFLIHDHAQGMDR